MDMDRGPWILEVTGTCELFSVGARIHFLLLIFLLFFICFFVWLRLFCVAQVGLQLTNQRCLYFPRAGLTSMYHYAYPHPILII